jgi:hypothetical protein
VNTTDADRLNLPYKGTGSRFPSPYVKIYGNYKINKNKRHIILNIYGKDSILAASIKNHITIACKIFALIHSRSLSQHTNCPYQ